MSDSQSVKVRYLDASALIKLFVDEHEQDGYLIRDFFSWEYQFLHYITLFSRSIGAFERSMQEWGNGVRVRNGVRLSYFGSYFGID